MVNIITIVVSVSVDVVIVFVVVIVACLTRIYKSKIFSRKRTH